MTQFQGTRFSGTKNPRLITDRMIHTITIDRFIEKWSTAYTDAEMKLLAFFLLALEVCALYVVKIILHTYLSV